MALVPACGVLVLVAGGPGLEAESPAGLGVADPLVAGVGVGVVLPVGAGAGADVWEGAAVGVDVTGAGDCGVLSWLGDVLGAGSSWLMVISGLAGTHEAPGGGGAPLPGTLPFGLAVPPWPPPPAGCPLPVLPAL
ncbi:MAG TPA: hypothetical protein VE733_23925, partial [Streptosporangiaceae bacterium]|nr:hypothetical protein [Streptosporangiaceae bacterium]